MRIVILTDEDYSKLRANGCVKHVIDYNSLIKVDDIVGVLYVKNSDIYQTDAIIEARVVDVLNLEYEGMCKHKILSLRVCFEGIVSSEK